MARRGTVLPAAYGSPAIANTLRRSSAADAAPYGSLAQQTDPSNYGSLFQQMRPALADPASGNLGNNVPYVQDTPTLRRGAVANPKNLSSLAAPDLFSYFMRQQAMNRPAVNTDE